MDIDVEKRLGLPVDPLIRIGRDIEVIGDRLKDLSSPARPTLMLDDETLEMLRRPTTRSRIPRPRISRPRRTR
ncbi:hypothetical protein HCX50_04095 [Microbacterium oxydans]|uniref:hypothetical protein n=1 Tax=Microbacterium sp. B19(2022) TaxID=2914045 RepID=UPI00143207C9|nr:hypothetical protein [Microbacterium sp. B19(2022)]NJI58607.1 hypothetical protein [Microbacterium sp. B19(2022)]